MGLTNYLNHHMCSFSDSVTDVIFFAAEPATLNEKGLLIVRRQISPFLEEGYTYTENDVDYLRIIKFQVFSST